jgi:small subunit ribosomal protein S20
MLADLARIEREDTLAQRHKSAVKRHQQSLKRAARNRVVRTHVRHALRELREAIAAKQVDSAQGQLSKVMKTVNQAVTKGVLHRNNAARRVSRLSRQVAALKAAS